MYEFSKKMKMRLGAEGSSVVEFPCPTYGYRVGLIKAVKITETIGGVHTVDLDLRNDYITCSFKLLVTEQQTKALHSFFVNESVLSGEGTQNYTMILPQGSGFFPAGPHYGDSGNFMFQFRKNPTFSEMKLNPFGYFEVQLDIKFVRLPDFSHALWDNTRTLGLHFSESDNFEFGEVRNLPDPTIEAVQEFGVVRTESVNGAIQAAKNLPDAYRAKITSIPATTVKMAELMWYIQRNRGRKIRVVAGKNYFLWGGQAESHGTFYVYLLESSFVFEHTNPDRWQTSFELKRVMQ